MAEIVRFPRRREVQKTEIEEPRLEAAAVEENWAVLVPFGPDACEPFHPLAAVRDDAESPDQPAS